MPHPGRRDVKDDEVTEAAVQQRPGQGRSAAADVDQSISG
jgi:hypothetical protein